jgi:hypothetical protein
MDRTSHEDAVNVAAAAHNAGELVGRCSECVHLEEL